MEGLWPKRCSNKIQKEETPAVARSFYFYSIILIIYFFVMKKSGLVFWIFFLVKFEFGGINVGCEKPVENHRSCGCKKKKKT